LLATIRNARMPEAGKATLKETLRHDLEAVLAKRPTLRLVKLADGAKDNWRFLGGSCPRARSGSTSSTRRRT